MRATSVVGTTAMCVTKDKMQPKLKDIKSIIGYGLPLLLGPKDKMQPRLNNSNE
jgi:hypothetical protein